MKIVKIGDKYAIRKFFFLHLEYRYLNFSASGWNFWHSRIAWGFQNCLHDDLNYVRKIKLMLSGKVEVIE